MSNSNVKFWLAIVASLMLLSVILFLSLSYGTINIPFSAVYQFFTFDHASLPAMTNVILSEIRIPRFLLAILVGAGLAMVGALLQTVTKNDLADPFLFGLSAGASAGVVAVISHFDLALGQWSLPVAAFAGATLSAASVILVFFLQKSQGVERLILSGLAVSFLFSAITGYLIYTGDQRSASNILFWSMGGLGLAKWENLPFASVGVIVLALFTMLRWRSLDAMLVDEDTSNSLGVSVKFLRVTVFILSALSTAIFVSLSGVIGFVGLIVPHLAKPFSGPSHRYLLPLCAFIGAMLLSASDLMSRVLIPGQELPIGLMTSAIGSMFILFFVLRKK
ncbi:MULTISPECIES: FecCD family ABC transporter permease [Vibrio]|jgi:iron complex transport system permease protein|uniref:ABC transporter permease n=2 Tax=Vibrio harveyi group TaxID=717610 RepID=A0ABX3DC14_9VIBR|nr:MULTISPECIES: iron ABC transporter permease [Vibrio harveyi group]KIP76525.1 ABC transporter permease [Vibrio harveyi]MCC8252130.1 iron ABC transporter permease [Vibrio campbellii CAIM 333]OHY94549.1 ABC transporter permease [Vibrio rotiferianus]WDG11134.1 iron ABC transporter permease [Vibrio campbellii]WVM78757.1 iron ABC transporter permease [Vibrio harveyi]